MFATLDKKNARAFFDLYMNRKEPVLAEFKARSETTGGPKASALNYSIESLTPLWAWLRKNAPFATEPPTLELRPPWYGFELITNPHNPGFHLTPMAAANADGFAYYWGETLLRYIPDTKWDIDPFPKDWSYCKPVILSDFFVNDPLILSTGMIAGSNRDFSDNRYGPDAIANKLSSSIENEKRYREMCEAAGGHVDPRVRKPTIFK